jgi:hypothetical protein
MNNAHNKSWHHIIFQESTFIVLLLLSPLCLEAIACIEARSILRGTPYHLESQMSTQRNWRTVSLFSVCVLILFRILLRPLHASGIMIIAWNIRYIMHDRLADYQLVRD